MGEPARQFWQHFAITWGLNMARETTLETVSVIGLGYIGLPTAAAFAARGIEVIGVDISPRVVETINRGRICIVEPDLDQAVHSAVTSGYLRATLTPEPAQAFLIAVPTPITGKDCAPDLSYVEAAARSIAPVLKRGDLVVLESTVPVGATERMAEQLSALRPDLLFPQHEPNQPDVRIAHCPERVLPGSVMREITGNDRIIGGMTPGCAEAARELYRIFVTGECLITDVRTAEMCKLTENASRDVSIAFANELSLICDRIGIDVWELIELANRHPRVNILRPGAGVGGHCIAVDPWFIIAAAPDEARLIRTARETNDAKPAWVMRQIRAAAQRYEAAHKTEPRIAVLGLAFKPDIDDLRESPALQIAEALFEEFGPRLMVVEPNVSELPTSLRGARLTELNYGLEQADVIAILVGHKAFRPALSSIAFQSHQLVVDAVGLLEKSDRTSFSRGAWDVRVAAE
jgi:UDP-N-acetyl-D-mannosaminuronic acid dehydrogenase